MTSRGMLLMDERITTVEIKVDTMAKELPEIKSLLKDMTEYLSKLAVLNVEKDHLVAAVDKNTNRLDKIEEAMPTIKLASSWVFKAVLVIMGLLGVSFIGVVLKIILFGLNTGVLK